MKPFKLLLAHNHFSFNSLCIPKYSIHGDLKGQKSITRRLRYCKSRSIIEGLCKYTFLKKVLGINPEIRLLEGELIWVKCLKLEDAA